MLFSDPHNIIGRHNPIHFCVTNSFNEARRFHDGQVAGTIALLNDETRRVSNLLDAFNAQNADSETGYEAYDEAIIEGMQQLVLNATGIEVGASLIKPHVQIGWNDAPHIDGCSAALLCGSERPTEVSILPPAHDYKNFSDQGKKRIEIEWGNSKDTTHPNFGIRAPISFLPATLVILVGPDDVKERVLHRIPRKLHQEEKRGFIAKATYTYPKVTP